jgi:hypothetical protein
LNTKNPNDHGVVIVEKPFEQLKMAINNIFESWSSQRALLTANIYRLPMSGAQQCWFRRWSWVTVQKDPVPE